MDAVDFGALLESAAKLQELVPDAVLVGGTAAALHAGHRQSRDHDHVLADLRERFDTVLDAVEADDGWALIRERPLEVEQVELPSGATLRVPTIDETLRIKAFLMIRRNQVRDYLDVAALADRMGVQRAAEVLREIDDYYAEQRAGDEAMASQVSRQLAQPMPRDVQVTAELAHYKGLDRRWTSWGAVTAALAEVAAAMITGDTS